MAEDTAGHGDDWTQYEETFLQNNWDAMTADEIASTLNRTEQAVYSKVYRMKEHGELQTSAQTTPIGGPTGKETATKFRNLEEGDVVFYERFYDETKRGEGRAVVEEIHGEEVWVNDPRHPEGAIWELVDGTYISEQTKSGDTKFDLYIKRVEKAATKEDDVRRIVVSKEDIKKGYEFNHKSPEYRNRRTAYIEVRGNDTNLHYSEEGHRYPKGGAPDFSIRPEEFVEESGFADYPIRHKTEDRVADEFPEMDRDSEAFQEKVDAWYEEEKKVFWNSVEWEDEVELRDSGPGPDRVFVRYQ
ncbi:MAG: hypothetical protein SVU32_07975 [Candidatus Nanohaloarchaea archaeon]|nr:hypothetical protein [Candidatus Nanohaloarchaea archaeon]